MSVCDIVFVHQNMPGQFRHLASALARTVGYRVFFLTCRQGMTIRGGETICYSRPCLQGKSSERLAQSFETSVAYGRSVANAALEMKARGIFPKLVVVHPGWGEGLFLRDVWPDARIICYAEYYYQPRGGDIGFDPMYPATNSNLLIARSMNANLLLSLEQSDVCISPTHWQKSRHPTLLQNKIVVIHEGIDTYYVAPDPKARFELPDGNVVTCEDEVITYVARNLEPQRGYHVFMQALPKLLAARPRAKVLIVGGTEVSYSPPPRDGYPDWKAKFAAEIDLGEHAGRVYHLGMLPYPRFLDMLRVSSAHIYLTYPFVLSWSCLEAMAIGCAMVASDTAPVREVIEDGKNGLLVPFFDSDRLVAAISRIIDDKDLAGRLGTAARETVKAHFDLRACLNAQLELVCRLLGEVKSTTGIGEKLR